jgi:hypothetical protein
MIRELSVPFDLIARAVERAHPAQQFSGAHVTGDR